MGLTHSVGQTVIYHGKTDIGIVRDENQDAFSIRAPENNEEAAEKGLLLVLADGMGGLANGAQASSNAVSTVSELYYGEWEQDENRSELLKRAALEANRRIFAESAALPGNMPMGSTLTTMVLLDGRGLIAHVGDSRAYRFSNDEGLEQLTRDHTLVQELADRGEIEPDSLPFMLHRNVLTRGLGLQEEVEVDILEIQETRIGDTFLICSDGLYDVVTDAEIESRLIAHRASQAELLDDLIELARTRGAPDNVTIVVARIEEAEGFSRSLDPVPGQSLSPVAGNVDIPAFGFLPRQIFIPLSYFAVFALGVLLALNFQMKTEKYGNMSTLEGQINQLTNDPKVESFDAQLKTNAPGLKQRLIQFLEWLNP